ncbi:MAG: tRNA (adenosine(37)-N6)-dimethylallyltransferase MiaA [Candidatus Yanofskybacteria bacterium RIFCSPLOWO2_01_FULL_41_34]|uniref:tRNA dimethylallyltransferase n=1 Tax=Candidatus Yanofskybacteria bacterium RIFCSPHIGHO2_01_FULL_41_26 TaxID=1802661 RepID=A0A1F8EBJ6_9BACT|nr:MAG: tRNA (adenosine(37)-N6)-dimethylallyltransferase MiaA [Candidatus Yanofskybacteria bacterium RIFCSPHIGHO2_01_FULL_41_26]OGN21557.1 MAG: tRNA (adenosine(37)-N6)-dimethylallyltransferase MiaA [Candidatus Yanofskybacteria bacterium RIFCSPLOWO2_01_FULL_41_34]
MTKINPTKIIVIVGPTASGKSGLGIKLAKKFNGEIISADSRQVYRGMDIGTGKVSKKEQKIVSHHLIDVASPKKQFTADDFKKLGEKSLKEILAKEKVPIVVGGTGFYIDVLLGRMSVVEVPPNKKLRARFDKFNVEYLFKMLKRLDPGRAKTIDRHNKRRLMRALEIVDLIGKVPSLNTNYSLLTTGYDILWLGLKPKNLEKRIKLRLHKRLKQGMVKEVRNLLKSGVSKKRLYDLGLEYRQISEYLASEKFKVKSLNNFKKSEYHQKLLREIIKYSKRQMTWFKRNKEIHWLAPSGVEGIKNKKEAEKLIRKFISPLP